MHQLGRRRFLYCIGGLAGVTASGSFFPGNLPGAEPQDENQLQKLRTIRRSSQALGSQVSITAAHRSAAAARRAIDAAFAELELVEELMSIYRPQSQLSQLNRDGRLDSPHPYLIEVLEHARQTSERTGGAFDITVQPLWELYAQAQRAGTLPSASELRSARERVDWQRVEIGSAKVRLRGTGTRITLNGIAQGYAADRVRAVLRDHGVEHAMIDTGELGAVGGRPQGGAWRVGIEHPRNPAAFVSLVKLAGRCLATSGDYATAFTPDLRHHHLLDPRTGDSPLELSSVSIAAGSALEADALSTAVFVLGLEAGMKVSKGIAGADALLVTKQGRTLVTQGFPIA